MWAIRVPFGAGLSPIPAAAQTATTTATFTAAHLWLCWWEIVRYTEVSFYKPETQEVPWRNTLDCISLLFSHVREKALFQGTFCYPLCMKYVYTTSYTLLSSNRNRWATWEGAKNSCMLQKVPKLHVRAHRFEILKSRGLFVFKYTTIQTNIKHANIIKLQCCSRA